MPLLATKSGWSSNNQEARGTDERQSLRGNGVRNTLGAQDEETEDLRDHNAMTSSLMCLRDPGDEVSTHQSEGIPEDACQEEGKQNTWV